jgi:glucose-1-phosphate cytidylyltransferase
MKVAILAGGLGTRLAEETEVRPKPMVEIGGRPILWHIMRHFEHHGFNQFVIALGYKGDYIRRFFAEYHSNASHLRVDLSLGVSQPHGKGPEERWVVDLIETGYGTSTGGRIRRLAPYIGKGSFLLTWGDGLSDVDLGELVQFHKSHGKLATVTAVHPPPRFGQVLLDGDVVSDYTETPLRDSWINGAFFVLEPGVFDYIDGDSSHWEREPMERLAADGELMAFRHEGFWQCMDTMREKVILEEMWQTGRAGWNVWDRMEVGQ